MGTDIVRTSRAGGPRVDLPPEKHPDGPDRPASAVPNQAGLSCERVADNTKPRKTHALRLLQTIIHQWVALERRIADLLPLHLPIAGDLTRFLFHHPSMGYV